MGERGAPRPRLGEATEKGKQILKSGLEILKAKKKAVPDITTNKEIALKA